MSRRHPHPSVYLLLILPFGVIGGYLQVSIAYLLAHAGVSVDKIAALIAVSYLPHTWKFLWAPIADITLESAGPGTCSPACSRRSAYGQPRRCPPPPPGSRR